MFALILDYYDIGIQVGELASGFLSGAASSGDKHLKPRRYHLVINSYIADTIGLKIPSYLMQQAKEVFD